MTSQNNTTDRTQYIDLPGINMNETNLPGVKTDWTVATLTEAVETYQAILENQDQTEDTPARLQAETPRVVDSEWFKTQADLENLKLVGCYYGDPKLDVL